MEFDLNNYIIQQCLKGIAMDEQGNSEEAKNIFLSAWEKASNDFEKYITAHFVSKHQSNVQDRLQWLLTTLQFAQKTNSRAVISAFPSLYANIAKSYEELNDPANAKKYYDLADSFTGELLDRGPFYHGTRADLQVGDLLTPGSRSNYDPELKMSHIYFTALINGAGLAAALANGQGRERVYIVEPTGSFENDPNVTDKKFPGNPTRSYRSTAPLKIVGEATDWVRQTPEQIQQWREKLASNKGKIIN